MQLNGSYGEEKSYVRDFFFFLVMIIIIVKTQGPPTMISSKMHLKHV